jgi:hypothetical protein
MRLSIPDLEMLMQAMDAVGWGATTGNGPTELGRRANRLKEKLRDEQRRLDRLATGALVERVKRGSAD